MMKNLQQCLFVAVVIMTALHVTTRFAMAEKSLITVVQGWEQFEAGDYTATEAIANRLLSQARTADDLALEFDALTLILASRYTQNRYSAELLEIEYRQEVIAKELNDAEKLAKVNNNLGYDLLTTGAASIDEIIPRLMQANQYYAREENHEGRWYTLMNLTWAYRRAGDLQYSKQMGEKAVTRAKAIEDRHAIIETTLNLAETLMAMGAVDAANSLIEEAHSSAGDIDDRDRHVFEVYHALHQMHIGQTPDEIALERAITALESKEIFYEMLGRSVLAEHYAGTNKIERAKEQTKQVLSNVDNFVPREAIERAQRVAAQFD